MYRGKTCIITGASSGLGEALALDLAKEQTQLILFSRNESKLQSVANSCELLGASCLVVSGDISKPDDCARLIEATVQKFGKIDYLINNAGVSMWSEFADITDLNVFQQLLAINYLGAVYCTHYALPYLRQSQGMIVVISSLQGKFAVPFHSGYAAAKHALHGFFDTLRIELQKDKVDVLIVAPSWLQGTRLRANAFGSKEKPSFRHHQSESGMTLTECCKQIKLAMAARKRELLLPKKARILSLIQAFSPQCVDWYIARRVSKELK